MYNYGLYKVCTHFPSIGTSVAYLPGACSEYYGSCGWLNMNLNMCRSYQDNVKIISHPPENWGQLYRDQQSIYAYNPIKLAIVVPG